MLQLPSAKPGKGLALVGCGQESQRGPALGGMRVSGVTFPCSAGGGVVV